MWRSGERRLRRRPPDGATRPGEDDGPNAPGGLREYARRHYDRLWDMAHLKGGREPEMGSNPVAGEVPGGDPGNHRQRWSGPERESGVPEVAAAGAGRAPHSATGIRPAARRRSFSARHPLVFGGDMKGDQSWPGSASRARQRRSMPDAERSPAISATRHRLPSRPATAIIAPDQRIAPAIAGRMRERRR